ncbi:MAG: alpha/beta hydrolase [Planctomycetota bacterium]
MSKSYFEKELPDPDVTECFASPEGRDLVTDVFVPDKNKRNGAAVILVHGGGWKAGHRRDFLWHAHRLSLHGYVACTVDYRLTPMVSFPSPLADCQSAVRWLRKNAGCFNIRSERIGAVGSSAGGHLVACLGVVDHEEDAVSARVNCVVDIHGVHDFVSAGGCSGKAGECWIALMGGSLSEERDRWIAASPALHVDGNSAPMLLVHDPRDEVVPYSQSLLFANVLMKACRPMQFLPSPGAGHGFIYNPGDVWTQRVWPVAVAWLDHHLLGGTG